MDRERQAETPAASAFPSSAAAAGAGEGAAAISAAEAAAEVADRAGSLVYACMVNAQYHVARRAHLEWRHRILMLLVVLSGSAIFAQIAQVLPGGIPLAVLAAIPTIAGTVDLVWDFNGKARDHAALQRRYYELAGDIESQAPDAGRLAHWTRSLHQIYGDEPPPMKALQVLAENAVIEMLHEDETARQKCIRIDWFRRLFANWFSFNGMSVARAGSS